MTAQRKTRLVDCNPRWISGRYTGQPGDIARGVHFDCPEGHEGCSHAIPFTPALDGTPSETWQSNGHNWQRSGDAFDTLVLSPSIRSPCGFHGFVGGSSGHSPGQIEFCGDSR